MYSKLGLPRHSTPRNDVFTVGIESHAIGSRVGGNETYGRGLLAGLAEIGWAKNCRVYLTQAGLAEAGARLKEQGFETAVVSAEAAVRLLWSLPQEVLKRPVDILHAQYHLPAFSSVKGVITVHDVSFMRYPDFFTRREYLKMRTLLPISLKRAAKIITVSECSKKEIIQFFGVLPEKIRVIYYGGGEEFRPADYSPEAAAVKTRYHLPERFILCVSNLQPRKNLSRLIKAYVNLRKNQPEVKHKLVIVGEKAWRYSDIFASLKESGLPDEIILTGYIPNQNLPALYSAADLFVYPSIFEGFGLPALEAMACGCPVITSNASSLPEVVGDAGIMVDPYDIEELAKMMYEVLNNEELRKKMKRKGLERAKLFSWEKCATETVKVYEEIGLNL